MSSLVAALPAAVKAYNARGGDDGTPADIWQDVIASYAALGDPQAGAALWNRKGSVERGETRSHTAFWLASLKEMGTPDFSVTADTPLYAVFKDKNGVRTYLAYNARSCGHPGEVQHGQGARRPAEVTGARPVKMAGPQAVAGEFVDVEGERCYVIRNVDRMPPFFVSVISNADHWLFVSSSGGLTAGRVSPDTALFPYLPVDRIHECQPHTGPQDDPAGR